MAGEGDGKTRGAAERFEGESIAAERSWAASFLFFEEGASETELSSCKSNPLAALFRFGSAAAVCSGGCPEAVSHEGVEPCVSPAGGASAFVHMYMGWRPPHLEQV